MFEGISITDVISAVSLVVLTITMFVMVWQNKIARSASMSQNTLSVVSFLMLEENRQARRRVLSVLSKKPIKNWSQRDIWAADKVCSSYASAGALIRRKYVDIGLFLDNWGVSIKLNYEILREHIKRRPRTWDDFDWIYDKVMQWENNHRLKL